MDPTWQIIPDNFTRDVFVSSDRAPFPEVARVDGKLFGHGLLRPLRRDDAGDFASGTGVALVRAAVGLVLGTVCSSDTTHGELPWRPEFGSLLHVLRLRNVDDTLADLARYLVVDALSKWVPAVRIVSVSITQQSQTYALYLRVVYDVMDRTGTRVLVPGLQTAVAVG